MLVLEAYNAVSQGMRHIEMSLPTLFISDNGDSMDTLSFFDTTF